MQIDTIGDASLVLRAAGRVYRKRSRLDLDRPVDTRFHQRDAEAITKTWNMMVEGIFGSTLSDEAAADLLREIEALEGESNG